MNETNDFFRLLSETTGLPSVDPLTPIAVDSFGELLEWYITLISSFEFYVMASYIKPHPTIAHQHLASLLPPYTLLDWSRGDFRDLEEEGVTNLIKLPALQFWARHMIMAEWHLASFGISDAITKLIAQNKIRSILGGLAYEKWQA